VNLKEEKNGGARNTKRLLKKILNFIGCVFQMLIPDEETARRMAERYARMHDIYLEAITRDTQKAEKVKEDEYLYLIKQEEERELTAGRK